MSDSNGLTQVLDDIQLELQLELGAARERERIRVRQWATEVETVAERELPASLAGYYKVKLAMPLDDKAALGHICNVHVIIPGLSLISAYISLLPSGEWGANEWSVRKDNGSWETFGDVRAAILFAAGRELRVDSALPSDG